MPINRRDFLRLSSLCALSYPAQSLLTEPIKPSSSPDLAIGSNERVLETLHRRREHPLWNDTIQEFVAGNTFNYLAKYLLIQDNYEKYNEARKRGETVVEIESLHRENVEYLGNLLAAALMQLLGLAGRSIDDAINLGRQKEEPLYREAERADGLDTLNAYHLQSTYLILFKTQLARFFRDEVILPEMKKSPRWNEAIPPWKILGPIKFINKTMQELPRLPSFVGKSLAGPIKEELLSLKTLVELASSVPLSYLANHTGLNSNWTRLIASSGRQPLEARVTNALKNKKQRETSIGPTMANAVTWPMLFPILEIGQRMKSDGNHFLDLIAISAVFASLKYEVTESIAKSYKEREKAPDYKDRILSVLSRLETWISPKNQN
jgi:hypothetical protein